MWTAATSPEGRNLHLALADAFEHGQTSLRIDPPRKLLALENPYDPASERAVPHQRRVALQGRYYLYFGPVPAALFFLPLKVVGVNLTDRWAASLLAFAGYACAVPCSCSSSQGSCPGRLSSGASWRSRAWAWATSSCSSCDAPRSTRHRSRAASASSMAASCSLSSATLRERPSLPLIALGSLSMGSPRGPGRTWSSRRCPCWRGRGGEPWAPVHLAKAGRDPDHRRRGGPFRRLPAGACLLQRGPVRVADGVRAHLSARRPQLAGAQAVLPRPPCPGLGSTSSSLRISGSTSRSSPSLPTIRERCHPTTAWSSSPASFRSRRSCSPWSRRL